ncbi:MAG: crotonobetainyl-CoA:carnitine CoA-transferase CaiB-like acyl-CoA transferase, partial [Gammaproteobacteria bacterium]
YTTNPKRNEHRASLIPQIDKIVAMKTSHQWIESLQKVAVPCGPINTIEEVFENPQIKHRGMKIEMKHPLNGNLAGVANPIKFSETPIEYKKAPPMLGEDSASVLQEVLGKSESEIQILRQKNII